MASNISIDPQTLSSIVAGAILQIRSATQPLQTPTPASTVVSQVSPLLASTSTASGASTGTGPWAAQLLPSFLKRRLPNCDGGKGKKKAKTQAWDRNIMCLPKSFGDEGEIIIPRATTRAELASTGLTGKIHLESWMTEREVMSEIRSVFQGPMNGDPEFPFSILQSAGAGSRSLIVPSISSSFQWTPKQVVQAAGQGYIYIIAHRDLQIPESHNVQKQNPLPKDEVDSQSDDDFVSSNVRYRKRPSACGGSSRTCGGLSKTKKYSSATSYENYVNLLSDSDSEDEALQQAMRESLSEYQKSTCSSGLGAEQSSKECPDSLKDILERLVSQIQKNEHYFISVRRQHVWSDSLRHFARPSFDIHKQVRISFVGEEAVDVGGPRREYWRLLMKSIASSSQLFEGDVEQKVLSHNYTKLQERQFYHAGRMISSYIAHGGPGFPFLAPGLYSYIAEESHDLLTVDEVADPDSRAFLSQLQCASTEVEFQEVLSSDCTVDMLLRAGYCKPVSRCNLKNRDEIIQAVVFHNIVGICKPELDQFLDGLSSLSVLATLRQYPKQMKQLFCHDKEHLISALDLRNLFLLQFSPLGSNSRQRDEATAMHWFSYLQDSEDGLLPVTLGDILSFVTGAASIPPVGFEDDLMVSFNETAKFPVASTCALTLTLPSKYEDYESFREAMNTALLGAHGFGKY